MTPPPPALRPLSAVLAEAIVAGRLNPVVTVPVRDAIGDVLAEPLTIPGPVPAEARALRAGYAVAARDLVGVSPYAPLLVPVLPPRVEAGDPLPPGCDAVLPEDGLARTGPLAEIVAAVSPGENARRPGEDGAAGEVLAPAGAVLRPWVAAAALAAGIREAAIRRCGCDVLTGAEDAPGSHLLAGIPGLHVASHVLAGAEGWGRALAGARAPLVLAIAKAGLGSAAEGLHPLARGLALRPGETAQVFLRGAQVIVVVPERMDAVFALAHALLAPLAAHLTGLAPDRHHAALAPLAAHLTGVMPDRDVLTGRLARKLTSTIGFTDLALVRRREGGLEPLALGSFGLAALAQAEGWLAIPPESEGLQEGETVAAHAI